MTYPCEVEYNPVAGIIHSEPRPLSEARRLWSLWDVIKQDVWKFVRAGMKMKDFQSALELLEQNGLDTGITPTFRGMKIEDMSHHKQDELRAFIKELTDFAGELELSVSQTLLFSLQYELPKTGQAFGLMLLAIRREMHEKVFFYIPSDRASFFDKEDIVSDATKNAFPMACEEISEASNCYATERFTACVFHSMRAVEIGLRALGSDLGVQFPDKPIELAEWQNIIEQVEKKIKLVVNTGSAQEKDDKRKFYSQAAAQFRYFKDGWRIRVAHARDTYTGSQALSVLGHTREFFEVLASRLSEPL